MFYVSVISFGFGILLGEFGFGISVVALLFLVALVVSAILYKERKVSKIIFVIGICMFLGNLRFAVSNTEPDKFFANNVGNQVSFEAVIQNEPDVRDTSTRYTVSPQDSNSKILLVANRYPQFEYGDKIKVTGKLDLPKNFKSEIGTEFDYISYLAKDDIHFLIYQPQIGKVGESAGITKLFASLYSIKNIFIERINRVVPEPNSSLLAGLIFGAKQSLGQNLLDKLKQVGLIHIVVLSGYNITIIASGILWVTSFLNKRRLGFLLTVICILLFSVMVGLTATVVRAAIMAVIAILARYLGRPNLALRTLFIAGIAMLLYNPLLLYRDPSFQLSFMAALGLILFSPFVYTKLKFIPEKFALREIAASTLAVQIFLLPMLIRMSGILSLISFLVNLIIPPLIPYTMALGALTGAVGLFSQTLSWPLGTISYILSELIIKIVELSSQIPFAFLDTGTLPLSAVSLWYIGYGFLYWKLTSRKNSLLSQTNSS